jgi:hypothetical protein
MFNQSYIWEVPFGKGKPWMNSGFLSHVLGGWQVSGIATFQSGRIANVTGGRNSVAYQDGQRPSASGQTLALSDSERSLDRWYNVGGLVMPASGVMGNIGRNVVVGPTQQSFDFSAHKAFRILEGHSLTFRFEAFNLFNRTNFGQPNTGITNVNFGKLTGTDGNPRILQLAIKVLF